MKKTLAVLLALITAASIALVSCENDNNNQDDSWDDGINDTEQGNKDTDTDTDESDTNNDTDTDTESETTNNITGWVDTNDVVYAGVELRLRAEPNAMSDSNIVKTVPFGTKLTRLSTNGTWDKVKVGTETTEYYVLDVLVSNNVGNFTFTDYEADKIASLTLNAEEKYNVCFYMTPFYCENQEYNYSNMLAASGIKKSNITSETYSIKKLAVSQNGAWYKVSLVGTVTVGTNVFTYTEAEPGIFYLQKINFDRQAIVDPTYNTSSGTSTPGGLG